MKSATLQISRELDQVYPKYGYVSGQGMGAGPAHGDNIRELCEYYVPAVSPYLLYVVVREAEKASRRHRNSGRRRGYLLVIRA